MPVQEHRLGFSVQFLSVLLPRLDDIFEDHIEEIIEASEYARKLSPAFHNYPQIFANAFIQDGQG
jgi:hypothetical protein